MRKAREIREELRTAERNLNTQKSKLKEWNDRYDCRGIGEDGRGFFALIFLAVGITTLVFLSEMEHIPVLSWMRFIFLLLSPILAIIESIRYAIGDIGYRTSIFILVTSILLILSAAAFFYFGIFLDPSWDAVVSGETPVEKEIWIAGLVVAAAFLIPVVILLIASVAKINGHKKDRKEALVQIKEYRESVKKASGIYEPLLEELKCNQTAAQKMFEELIKQNDGISPEAVKEAAEYGCGDAGMWLALRYAKEFRARADMMTSEKRSYYHQKIKEGLFLSDGCSEEKLKEVLNYWIDSCVFEIDPLRYCTEYRAVSSLEEKCKRIGTLCNYRGNEDVRIFAEEAYPKYSYAARRAGEIYRAGMSSSGTTNQSGTSGTTIVSPLIPSGEVDLSGTKPTDWA